MVRCGPGPRPYWVMGLVRLAAFPARRLDTGERRDNIFVPLAVLALALLVIRSAGALLSFLGIAFSSDGGLGGGRGGSSCVNQAVRPLLCS